MKISIKEQLGAILSALTCGAAEYRIHAANQNAQANLSGVIFATVRANFLMAIYRDLQAYERAPEILNPEFCWTLTSDRLDELADQAAASLHETLHYDATRPGPAQVAVAEQGRQDAALMAGETTKPEADQ